MLRLLALAASLAPAPARSVAALPPSCEGVLPPERHDGVPRALTPEDLVRLRDIGPVDPEPHEARLLSLSPDGRHAAFQLRRADPDRNAYCLAMVVLELNESSRPRIVAAGGELIRVRFDFRGKAAFPTGIPIVVTPRWSPDGSWIAFLKRQGGRTQVWRADTDGSGSAMLTEAPDDVEDFRISPDGTAIIYATRPGLREARAAIEREGLSGFHYDDRYSPASSHHPFPPAPIEREAQVLDLRTGVIRGATDTEAGLLSVSDVSADVWPRRAGAQGRRTWTGVSGARAGAQTRTIMARTTDGRTLSCDEPACMGATRPWWMPDGRHVRFFRREGWARASTAIYEWAPEAGTVRNLYVTEDLLADCLPDGEALICLRERSLEPRHLERLDPVTGRRELLFDPNPEFAGLTLGMVERLHWRNAHGLETAADLVLPVGYRPGERYPLVIVQYDTRGFLRGGTGDEYPIQAFANRGHAVLSVRRPESLATARGARDPLEIQRLDLQGFADRRSALSSVETGVRLLIERGIVDPGRVGITGMSDGATTATFALLHSDLFATAAMSNCCFDTTLPTRVGPQAARHFHDQGYPRMTDEGDAFWSEISLSRNARRIRTPILLQVSDDELMTALESFTSLREVGAPIDMFVFPDEHHVKWQPAHRLAVYERSLDWFDYWLRDVRSRAPERQAELRHWGLLRQARAAPSGD